MQRTIVVAATLLLVVLVPWTASARPHHPDTSVQLAMNRDGSDVHVRTTLHNVGGATAHNVRLELTLPGTGWRFTAPQCAASASGIDCRLQELGKDASWTMTASRTPGPCDSIQASAHARTPSDKRAENDRDSRSLPDACGAADLVLRKIGHRDLEGIHFRLMITNRGPMTSHNLVLTDPLPQHQRFRWEIEGDDARSCTLDQRRVECRWSELPAWSHRVIEVWTRASLCAEAYNEARVASSDDPNPENNVANARVDSLCPSTAPLTG